MDRLTLRMPEEQLQGVAALVDRGQFSDRSAAIRTAVRRMLDEEIDWWDQEAPDHDAEQRRRQRQRLASAPEETLTGRHLKAAYERAGEYGTVNGRIAEVRDDDRDRRTLVVDGTVLTVADLLDFDLSQPTNRARSYRQEVD